MIFLPRQARDKHRKNSKTRRSVTLVEFPWLSFLTVRSLSWKRPRPSEDARKRNETHLVDLRVVAWVSRLLEHDLLLPGAETLEVHPFVRTLHESSTEQQVTSIHVNSRQFTSIHVNSRSLRVCERRHSAFKRVKYFNTNADERESQ